jgi:biotin carboxyl carrier protein
MARERYQIQIGDRTYSLETDGERLFENGASVPISVESLGAGRYSVLLGGQSTTLSVEESEPGSMAIRLSAGRRSVKWLDRRGLLLASLGLTNGADTRHHEVRAPMPGLVRQVLVIAGQEVEAGSGLLVLEAMKMENELKARTAGIVKSIHISPGDTVAKNALLIETES